MFGFKKNNNMNNTSGEDDNMNMCGNNTCGANGGCCGQGCEDCPCQNGGACMKSSNENSFYDDTLDHTVTIGKNVDDFSLQAFHEGKIKDLMLSDYADKWVILFFYPADFTFVCPTELEDMSEYYEKFKALGAEVLAISTDSVYAHKAWHDASDTIKKINFPMLADTTHELARYYNVLVKDEGMAMRGTFVIDPDGVLRIIEINDNGIGRNAKELYRKLQAAKFVRENGANVCPAKWEPGDDVLTPGVDLVGKI